MFGLQLCVGVSAFVVVCSDGRCAQDGVRGRRRVREGVRALVCVCGVGVRLDRDSTNCKAHSSWLLLLPLMILRGFIVPCCMFVTLLLRLTFGYQLLRFLLMD